MATIKANCRKVICIGRNFADHISELSSARPAQPFFFLKPPSSILAPPHAKTPILIPRGVNVHYEVELGLVIGRPSTSNSTITTSSSSSSSTSSSRSTSSSSSSTASTASALTGSFRPLHNLRFDHATNPAEADRSALNYISHYFLAIDLTARNVQNEAKKKGLPWSIAKGFDTFLPISGPISPSSVPDPHDITLSLSVNNNVKQHDSTGLMLFRIPRILEDISKVMSLEEGDIVLTGTPKGVGPIVAGDHVVCTIESRGQEIKEGRIEIGVEDADGPEEGGYVYTET